MNSRLKEEDLTHIASIACRRLIPNPISRVRVDSSNDEMVCFVACGYGCLARVRVDSGKDDMVCVVASQAWNDKISITELGAIRDGKTLSTIVFREEIYRFEHLKKREAVKWILEYLRGTGNVGLMYGTDHSNHVDVTGFVDSDYAKDPNKGRSITGYTFLVQGCVVSWKATLQHVVALSTTEAEYMALTKAVKEAIWLRGLLEELVVKLNNVVVNCDNQGVIHLSCNHVFHERTKHTNVRYHFIREVLKAKTVEVMKVSIKHNAADAFTKVVPGLQLQHCLELLSVDIG
ncbi:hypothetical protein Tco_0744522 [Tanacetum coccineum]